MKRVILLLCLSFVTACSLPQINWNPFAEDEEKGKETYVYENVNPFLWKAAYDKLAFLGFTKNDPAQGLLETRWSSPENSERLMVQVWISSGRLCADALQAAVIKQKFENGAWKTLPANPLLSREIEKEILLEARDLYKSNIVR